MRLIIINHILESEIFASKKVDDIKILLQICSYIQGLEDVFV